MAPRLMKTYFVPSLNGSSSRIDFSSSPALLSSVDDFYLVRNEGSGKNLAVMETTIDVYDNKALELIHHDTMLSWTRARIASEISSQYFSTNLLLR